MKRVLVVVDTVIRGIFAFPFAIIISQISGRIVSEIMGDKW